MYIFRWLVLWSVIGLIVASPVMFDRDEPGLVRQLMDVRAALAQEALEPSATATESMGLPPAPTPTDLVSKSPSPAVTAEVATAVIATIDPRQARATTSPTAVVTTETATGTATPTTSPTIAPTVIAALPDLAPTLDDIGPSSRATIRRSGGRATSTDGRVVIDFPNQATTADLDVRITKLPRDNGYARPTPNQAFVAIWQFDATADNGSRAVHQFGRDVTITVRFGPDEMAGLNARTLAFWSFVEDTQEWQRIPGIVDETASTLTVKSNHFSVNAATASSIVNSAALLDGKNVNPQSGSAALSIPIELPPGVGGLTPSLDLSYDSGRLGEMRTYDAGSGWVGVGWSLDVPNISFSQDTAYTPDQLMRHRAFLSIGAIGGEMMQDPAGAQDGGYIWRLRDNPYIKIRAACNAINCVGGWTVWDQSGTKYTFGGGTDTATEFRRFFRQNTGTIRDYRADVNRIEDIRGNSVVFEYEQIRINDLSGTTLYVIDSRLEKVKYNNDAVVINFVAATDQCIAIAPNTACTNMRFDTPRDVPWNSQRYCTAYFAPPVRETQKLSQIDVTVSGALVRQYQFVYEDTARQFQVSCGKVEKTTGTLRLKDVVVRMPDPNGVPQTFNTTSFQYTSEPHAFRNGRSGYPPLVWAYEWPHLTRVENGLGGVVRFDYEEKMRPVSSPPPTVDDYYWSRSVVIEERHQYGAGQPDVYTTYSYPPGTFGPGPYQYDWPNPLVPTTPAYQNPFNAAYRGFSNVTETDAAGYQTLHSYHATGTWAAEVMAGREAAFGFADPAGNIWYSESTYWQIRNVSNDKGYGQYLVNFVYPQSTSTTLRDGSKTRIINYFDDYVNCAVTACYGLLTTESHYIELPYSLILSTTTKTAYHKNTTKWLFLPKYVEQIDSANGNALLGCARTYYDGANTTNPNSPPAIGIVTATSAAVAGTVAQCESGQPFTSSTNAYVTYETHTSGTKTYGNVAQSSVPTSVSPESQTPPSGSTPFGWIPTGQTPPIKASLTLYDPTHHVFPLSVTNVLEQVTSSVYDYRLGLPTIVTEPTGRVTTTVYDTFGRVSRAYDGLDTTTIPTVEFTYDIGAVNKVTTKQRTAHNIASSFRLSTSCLDGFGREYDRREQFRGTTVRSTRTDYNARGLAAVTTAPIEIGTSIDCAWYDVMGLDRTAMTYDPLGNVVKTTALAPNKFDGPSQQTVYNGLSTVTYDEKFNRTEQVQNPSARTTVVKESSAFPIVITLRPTGQGFTEWNASPDNGPHYLNLDDDPTPDDATTFVRNNPFVSGGAIETHMYANAGVAGGSVIRAVRFNFRWQEGSVATPPIDSGFFPVFRQSSVNTPGPLQRRSNSEGWGDDKWELTVNPRTQQPWTVAELNAGLGLEFGFKYRTVIGSDPSVTQAWLEILIEPPAPNNTTYQYDGGGRLASVTDSAGNVTTMTYDLLGRKLTMADPDMGTWSYTYDAAGSLATQTDARLITTTLTYDAAQRLTQKTYSNLAPSVTFAYDGYNTGSTAPVCAAPSTAVGRMTTMTDGSGQQFSCFDVRGRSTQTRRMVDSAPYDMTYAYNALDAVTQITYPDNEVVQYTTTTQGDMTGMSSTPSGQTQQALVTNAVSKAWGALESLTLGNSLVSSYSYDFRKRVTSIQTGFAQNVTLTYDDASNVKSVSDLTGTSETVTYTYDHLNRLTQGEGFAGSLSAQYSYDAIGNMTAKQEGAASLTHTYPASGAARPHAVSSISGTLARAFTYDANGNMIASASSTTQVAYGFDAENRLTEIVSAPPAIRPTPGFECVDQNNSSNGSIQVTDLSLVGGAFGQTPGRANFAVRDVDTNGVVGQPDQDRLTAKFGQNCSTSIYRYVYDGAGTLLKRTLQQNGTTTSTTYIGGVYEKTNTGAIKKYYAGFGRTIAVRDVPTGTGNGTLSYILPDHLGSASVVTSDAGLVLSEMAYWPYGATRSGGITQTDKRYTGQQEEPGDAALGLYNYKARFYSTTLGRFVSADPVADGLNRYSYARGNPAAYTDPSGNDHCRPPCPVRAPTASRTPLPNQSDVDNCAQHLVACLTFSFAMDYGISPAAVVFVMGLNQSFSSDRGGFNGYALEFLERYHPGCKGRGTQCWDDAQILGRIGGADAMYDIFGIQFVESDWNGMVLPGLGAAWAGLTDQGSGALKNRLDNLKGKDLKGVVGYSLGGDTIARFFLKNPAYAHVPFYMDSAYPTQAAHSANDLDNSVGRSGFWDRYCIGVPCGGHEIDRARAADIFDRFDAFRVKLDE